MEFLDRKEELAELKRVLNPDTPPNFVVVFGCRRLGKSTLIKKVLGKDDIDYMAGDFVDTVQRDMLRNQLAEKFPERLSSLSNLGRSAKNAQQVFHVTIHIVA